jgi:hypothetical protein
MEIVPITHDKILRYRLEPGLVHFIVRRVSESILWILDLVSEILPQSTSFVNISLFGA